MTVEIAVILVLLAVCLYQRLHLARVRAALAMAGGLMDQANTRLLELLEHVKTQEAFINDLVAQLPEVEPLQEQQV